jgi:hypothetical protein
VCSIDGGALQRVAAAIDRLEADRGNTDTADLEARVAAVWSMVTEIDPELARLASGYEKRGLSRARPTDRAGGAALAAADEAEEARLPCDACPDRMNPAFHLVRAR